MKIRTMIFAMIFFCMPAWAAAPKTNACRVMASVAHEIMIAKAMNAKDLATEQQAMKFSRGFGLPNMHVDFLDGFIALIYQDKVKPQPGDVTIDMYTACVMR